MSLNNFQYFRYVLWLPTVTGGGSNGTGFENWIRGMKMAPTKCFNWCVEKETMNLFKCLLRAAVTSRILRSISTSLRPQIAFKETSSNRHIGTHETRLLRVAVIGEPNCGKSTLTNSIVGNQVSVVTHVPHTTRQRTTGVYTEGIILSRGVLSIVKSEGLMFQLPLPGKWLVVTKFGTLVG